MIHSRSRSTGIVSTILEIWEWLLASFARPSFYVAYNITSYLDIFEHNRLVLIFYFFSGCPPALSGDAMRMPPYHQWHAGLATAGVGGETGLGGMTALLQQQYHQQQLMQIQRLHQQQVSCCLQYKSHRRHRA